MKENISPEEKLLRLIKQGAKKSSPDSTVTASKSKKPIFVSTLFRKFLRVSYLNNLLLFSLVLSLLSLVISLIMPSHPVEIGVTQGVPKPQEAKKTDLLPQMKPYSDYAKQIGKRSLFVSPVEKTKEGTSGPKSLTLQEMTQGFSLIGIMEGQNLQAIIEDKKAKKTYFLNRGDYLGQIKIKDIQANKVILEYQGEIFDLFL